MKNLSNTLSSNNQSVPNRGCVVESKNCDTHGVYLAKKHWFMTGWTQCQSCDDDRAAEKAAIEEAKAANARHQMWVKRLDTAAIPLRFVGKTLDNYVAKNGGQQKALDFARRYAESFDSAGGRCAIFCGAVGTGKTHLSIGIAMHVMAQDKALCAVFTTVQRLMRQVKGTWAKDSKLNENQVMEMYADADLLILDEVGVQFGSDTEKQILFDLLNSRYERCRPTIFISNLQKEEIKSYLGDRVYDRIREDGGRVVPFDWASHRGAD